MTEFSAWQGDITRLDVDAIVNAGMQQRYEQALA